MPTRLSLNYTGRGKHASVISSKAPYAGQTADTSMMKVHRAPCAAIVATTCYIVQYKLVAIKIIIQKYLKITCERNQSV